MTLKVWKLFYVIHIKIQGYMFVHHSTHSEAIKSKPIYILAFLYNVTLSTNASNMYNIKLFMTI